MLSKPSNVTELKQFWIIPWIVNHLHTHSFITLDVMFMLLSLPDMKLHYGDLTDSTCLVKIINQVKPTEIYNLGAQSHVKVASSHLLFPVAHMNILLDNRCHCMYVCILCTHGTGLSRSTLQCLFHANKAGSGNTYTSEQPSVLFSRQ